MQLKVTVRRTIIVSPEVLEDIECEAADFSSAPSSAPRLYEMYQQLNIALNSIEADLREPQPGPAAPRLVRPAGQGSPAAGTLRCADCGAALELVGMHYDRETGLVPQPEYECPNCNREVQR
jgi:hypothetical protein